MPLTHLPSDTDAETVAAALDADGAVIVDDLASPALLDALAQELDPYLAATPLGPDDFSGRRTRRCGALIGRVPSSRQLVMHPLTLATVGAVLADSTNFQLHLTQAIAIGPDEPAQPLHRDQWAFDFFQFPLGFEVQCNTIWALDEFTAANGATRVVPRSHREPDGQGYTEADTVAAEMSRGSALFYTGAVYHGGGANRSDAVRVGLNLTYNRAWLRQEENQYLTVPADIAATLPEDLLRIMGYSRGAYSLGYIDDLRDPIAAVRPDLVTTGFGDPE